MNAHSGKRPGAGRPKGAASLANEQVRQEAAVAGALVWMAASSGAAIGARIHCEILDDAAGDKEKEFRLVME